MYHLPTVALLKLNRIPSLRPVAPVTRMRLANVMCGHAPFTASDMAAARLAYLRATGRQA